MGPETEPDPVTTGGLLLAGARLADGRTVDVRLCGERIEAVGTPGSLGPTGSTRSTGAPGSPGARRAAGRAERVERVERVELGGYLLLPAPAEPHAHLDEALTAEPSGPADVEDLRRRITEAALTHLGYGSTAVRTHVLVSDATGLARLDAAQQAARDLRGLMDLQITAVPGPLTGRAGQEGRALLREAARVGVHALGGGTPRGRAPGDPDADGSLAALLELAHACGLPLDLHLGSPGDPGDSRDPRHLDPFPALLDQLPAGSLLTVAGPLPPSAVAALGAAADRVGVVVLPQGGCGAGTFGPGGFDAATVRRLAEAGVPLAAGSGALRDASRPVGRADPIEAAFLLAAQAGLSAAAAYDAVGPGARARLGLPDCVVEAGRPAELLALRGETLAAALSGGHSRVVLHAGRVVSRTSAVREYADTTTAAVPRQVRPPRPA